MGLNESKGNMYEFITHTWNTIKGACPHDCSYCYMKKWGKQNPIRFDQRELKTDLGSGNFIFVGSSCDMWARDINEMWIIATIVHCSDYNNVYFFQSKNPKNFELIKSITDLDYAICTTIETNRHYRSIMQYSPLPVDRAIGMSWINTGNKFVTIEPIMDFDIIPMVGLIKRCDPVQVNIGADSGNNNLPEPDKDKILELIYELNKFTIVHEKKNLKRLIT
jgi:hypothetical protein